MGERVSTGRKGHDDEMHGSLSGSARDGHVWLGELPSWAALQPVGVVDTYLRWNAADAPAPRPHNSAAWGFRVGHGGKDSAGVLGGTYEPHDHPYIRVAAAATVVLGAKCPEPFSAARVGLPHEYVGGVLAGAAHEAHLLGPGVIRFMWGSVHEVDSSWEAFRLLAIGVVRLLSRTAADGIPTDALPYFGGSVPATP